MRTLRGLPALLTLLVLAGTAHAAPRAAERTAWTRMKPVLAVVDSLLSRNDLAGAEPRLDSLDAAFRAAGDAAALRVLEARRIRLLYVQNRMAEVVARAKDLEARARAAGDTVVWVRSGHLLGHAYEVQQRTPDALATYRRGLALARAARLPAEQALCLRNIGYVHLFARRSQLARDHFAAALRLNRPLGDDWVMLADLGALARAEYFLKHIAEARRLYLECVVLAERRGAMVELASHCVNLGHLELEAGDPDAAPAYFERALRISLQIGDAERAALAAQPLAEIEIAGGDWARADSMLTSVLPAARGLAARGAYVALLTQLAVARQGLGRDDEAFALVRQAAALFDSCYTFQVENNAIHAWWALSQAARWNDAWQLADTTVSRLHARGQAETPVLEFYRDWALSRAGRPREALPRMRAFAGAPEPIPTGGYGMLHVIARTEIARAYHALGRIDSALVWYRVAARAWEASWEAAREPRLRLDTEDSGMGLGFGYAVALLDARRRVPAPTRALEAFAVLQRFHSRILTERILGPEQGGARALAAFDVAAFRARTLRAGEVFLDVTPNPDSTLIVAVTRDSVRTWIVAGREALDARLVRFAGLVERPASGDPEAWRLPAAALGRELFGPVAGWIARAPRVLVAAGALGGRPLGMLIVPGTREPLSVERDVAFVPSAPLLVAARSATGARVPAREAMVALARTTNDRGQRLAGAAEEVRALSTRFTGVTALVDPARGATVLSRQELARAGVIHLAAHAQMEERRPWRAGLLIGDPRGRDAWLRASAIARLRVPARLVVLSSCRSVGAAGADLSALQGLAPAWLAAGAPTVVAAQWNVDDAVTTRLMRAFYDQLARGQSTSAALRAAQRALRDDPATAAPRYWAGFVVMGEPETRVALAARR